jgi:methyl-accepting chemotaxis protein
MKTGTYSVAKSIKFGIQSKILVALTVIVMACILVLTVLGTSTVNNIINQAGRKKLQSDVALSMHLVDQQYNGNWEILNGKLWKSSFVVNNNQNVMDYLKQEIGDDVGIFQGDTLVATTVKTRSGKFATGEKAPQALVDAVLRNGQVFVGRISLAGQPYLVACEPILDPSQKVIGIWLVGEPLRTYLAQESTFRSMAIVVGLVILIVGLFVGWFITRRIVKPLIELVGVSQKVGDGDLQAFVGIRSGIQSNDEIGLLSQGFRKMVQSLQTLIQGIRDASAQVAASAQQLSAGAEQSEKAVEQVATTIVDAAASIENQAHSIERSSASVADMVRSFQRIFENSEAASHSALRSFQVASAGADAVRLAVGQMQSIHHSVDELAKVVQRLQARSKDIDQFVHTIRDIAEQTNLLALNAAIEAARAGESGRGFAVVADEVRKLADQAADSAKQIAALTASIHQETQQAAGSMQASVQEVLEGIRTVNQVVDAFTDIQQSVQSATQQIQEVTSKTEELLAQSELLKEDIQNVAKLAETTSLSMQIVPAATEEQLAIMQEIRSAVQALSLMAEKLQESVNVFKV